MGWWHVLFPGKKNTRTEAYDKVLTDLDNAIDRLNCAGQDLINSAPIKVIQDDGVKYYRRKGQIIPGDPRPSAETLSRTNGTSRDSR